MINGKVMFGARFSEVSRTDTRLGQSSKLGVGIRGEVLYYTAPSQKAPDDSGEIITDVHTHPAGHKTHLCSSDLLSVLSLRP